MTGLGWQELVILLVILAFLAAIWVAPAVLVARVSARDQGQIAWVWVIVAVVFSWLGAIAYFLFGRSAPGNS